MEEIFFLVNFRDAIVDELKEKSYMDTNKINKLVTFKNVPFYV
jgi:hypothetical protein